jgi:hypothetical protein
LICHVLISQHHEGIYWCPAPLRDEGQRSNKVRDATNVQAAPPPPVNEYLSDSTVGSDDEAPATSSRASSKVAAPRRTRQATGKISASRAATTITATQSAEAKKKKQKRTRSTVSVDTTIVSSDVETIEVDDDEGDTESPSATAAPSAGTPRKAASMEEQAVGTPRQTLATQERSRSSIDVVGDLGSHKRLERPLLSPASLASGRQPSKSKDLFLVLFRISARCASIFIEVFCLCAECPQ